MSQRNETPVDHTKAATEKRRPNKSVEILVRVFVTLKHNTGWLKIKFNVYFLIGRAYFLIHSGSALNSKIFCITYNVTKFNHFRHKK